MQFNSLELVHIGEDGEKKGSPNLRRSERRFIVALQKNGDKNAVSVSLMRSAIIGAENFVCFHSYSVAKDAFRLSGRHGGGSVK
jgi:hypothetical protein